MILLERIQFMVCVHCVTFNHSNYITDAMNGFTMQETNFPFVCTIVDDASTDGEQEVISNYLRKHFDLEDKTSVRNEETDDYVLTFAQHKTNRNCYFTVLYLKYNHYSIKKSKKSYFEVWNDTKYVAMCEGDDYWTDPLKLQRQVSFLKQSTDYLAVAENSFIYNTIKETKTLFSTEEERDLTLDELISKRRFATASVLCTQKIYRAFHEHTFKYRYDTMIWSFIASKGKFKYLTDVSSVYRRGMQGITEYTEPYKWASIVEKWNKELMLQFGHLYNKRISLENIYNEYWKSLHKIYNKRGFCINFFKCLYKCIYYNPQATTKHFIKKIVK